MDGWRRTVSVALLVPALLFAQRERSVSATPFTVAVIRPSAIDATMEVGLRRGIFARHGLDVTVVPVANGFESLKAVVDGRADSGATSSTALARTVASGTPVKAVVVSNGDATGAVPTDPYVAIVARAPGGIRPGHLEDLRGKRVGLRIGSDFHQYFLAALAARRLDVADVTIVDQTDLLTALRSGAVDAIVTAEPGASQIASAVGDGVLVQRGGNVMQFLELRVVTPRYLADHPGVVKQFVEACAEAAQYVRAHPDETASALMATDFPALQPALVRAAVGFLHPDPRVSKVTAAAADAGATFALRTGAAQRVPTFEEMFDLAALQAVEREHPDLFSDLPPVAG